MALNYISAAEAASLIKHGYNIGLSGFTPAGTAKAVTAELAKIAEAEHAKGNPFQIGIFTGASTGDSCDGILSRAKAIRKPTGIRRTPTLLPGETARFNIQGKRLAKPEPGLNIIHMSDGSVKKIMVK